MRGGLGMRNRPGRRSGPRKIGEPASRIGRPDRRSRPGRRGGPAKIEHL